MFSRSLALVEAAWPLTKLAFLVLVLAGLVASFFGSNESPRVNSPVSNKGEHCEAPSACWQQQQAKIAEAPCKAAIAERVASTGLTSRWEQEWLGVFDGHQIQKTPSGQSLLFLTGERLMVKNEIGHAQRFVSKCWFNTATQNITKIELLISAKP